MSRAGLVGAVLAGLAAASVYAENRSAGDAAHVFRDGLGARAHALAGAYVAVAEDLTAGFWNPAGLVQTPSLRLAGVLETRHGGLLQAGAMGGAVTSPHWGIGLLLWQTDLYSAYQASLALALKDIAVGCSARLYNFGVSTQHGRGIGLDIGLKWATGFMGTVCSIGLVSRDVLWTPIAWDGYAGRTVDWAAWVTRGGLCLGFELDYTSVALSADVEMALKRPPLGDAPEYWRRSLQLGVAFGVEISLRGIVLRVGASWPGMESGDLAAIRLTFGGGIRVGVIAVDAAWVSGRLGSAYVLGAEFFLLQNAHSVEVSPRGLSAGCRETGGWRLERDHRDCGRGGQAPRTEGELR